VLLSRRTALEYKGKERLGKRLKDTLVVTFVEIIIIIIIMVPGDIMDCSDRTLVLANMVEIFSLVSVIWFTSYAI
jgi:hypothetical protein